MIPLMISGIATLASSAIDAWSSAANRHAAIDQAKFDGAMNRALGTTLSQPAGMTNPQTLTEQLRNQPEIRGILDVQDPSRPASVQVSGDGRVWLQVPGNTPVELTVSAETRALAQQLNAARMGGTSSPISSQPVAGSLVTLR